ncbi:MAG: hypothetical protein D6696_21150 [Acidobacteria bacterium]|nr:MAG: hypothetical protein D6696_21150 [Acidobacteriota bacterium]
MSRTRVPLRIFVLVAGVVLALGNAARAQVTTNPQQPVGEPLPGGSAPTVTRLDAVHVNLGLADGSTLIGGQLTPDETGCGGPFAFVERRNADGTLAWRRVGQANPTSGLPLFAGASDVDPLLIAGGSVRDAIEAADGTLYLTGEVTEAWQEADGSARRRRDAFVVRLDGAGNPLRARLLHGPLVPPRVPAPPCSEICVLDPDPGFDDCSGESIALANFGSAVIASECLPPGAADSDVLVSKLNPDLSILKWNKPILRPGSAEPLDVAIDADNQIWIAGREDNDAILHKTRGNGDLLATKLGVGPCGDAGRSIRFAGDQVVVDGNFAGFITFDGTIVDGAGEEQSAFEVTYDRTTVQLVTARKISQTAPPPGSPTSARTAVPVASALRAAPGGVLPPPSPPPMPPLEDHQPVLESVDVLVGKLMTGGPNALIEAGEGLSLGVQGVLVNAGDDFLTAVVRFTFSVHELAPVVESIRLKLSSPHCVSADFSAGGGDVGSDGASFLPLGSAELCAGDESIIDVEVPPEVNQALGFSTVPLTTNLQLLIDLTLHFTFVQCQPGLACPSSGPGCDSDLDQITVTTDYPN